MHWGCLSKAEGLSEYSQETSDHRLNTASSQTSTGAQVAKVSSNDVKVEAVMASLGASC